MPCARYHLLLFVMQEAVAMTRSIQDPEEAAKKLLQEAYKRESSDNITCVVVRFLHGQGSSGYA
jgi:protein phosphatase 1L